MLVVLIAATELQPSQGHLHCNKWKQKYELHDCRHRMEITRDVPIQTEWTSCCVPTAEPVGSGDGTTKYNSSVYTIATGKFSTTRVWCDMNTEDGGWLTILRRTKDSKENFELYREDYMSGFGDLQKDFWLGLRTMQVLTEVSEWELRVDLYDSQDACENESSTYAKYSSFKVRSHPKYTLELGNFTGSDETLLDSLGQFSDQDFVVLNDYQDNDMARHCAVGRGGWWYTAPDCYNLGSVLTKEEYKLGWWVKDSNSILFEKSYYRYEMKIRPTNCLAV